MGNGMNKVLPGLYVGNYRDSKDHIQLDKYKITHIIAIHDSPRRLLADKHYLCVMAADTPDQNLSQYFSICNDFIHAARLREGNVLIHCLAGMSRSVTVAVAYIMTATNLNWKESLKVVRAGRAVANPNAGFQTQLQDFETFRLTEERRRLRERFPSTALEQLDRGKCVAALNNYRELLEKKDICEGNCTRADTCPTGVCNFDKSKGFFRRRRSSARRPSTVSEHSRVTATQSCPSSPCHSLNLQRSASIMMETQSISEAEEVFEPIQENQTCEEGEEEDAAYTFAINDARREREQLLQQQQHQHLAPQVLKQQKRQKILNALQSTNTADSNTSSLSKLSKKTETNFRSSLNGPQAINCGGPVQRSASAIDCSNKRPKSSPAGLHNYTGAMSSTTSLVSDNDSDKSSAIYLGCSMSGLTAASMPTSPAHSPHMSQRHGLKRKDSISKILTSTKFRT